MEPLDSTDRWNQHHGKYQRQINKQQRVTYKPEQVQRCREQDHQQ
jgi:hypothetical protein